jgi:hypothetical protein
VPDVRGEPVADRPRRQVEGGPVPIARQGQQSLVAPLVVGVVRVVAVLQSVPCEHRSSSRSSSAGRDSGPGSSVVIDGAEHRDRKTSMAGRTPNDGERRTTIRYRR